MLSLGALHKETRQYVYPKIASKQEDYVCPECDKDLILCQGSIRAHHFRHKVDHVNPCHHYDHPSEAQIHKDAKLLLKTILDQHVPFSVLKTCMKCKTEGQVKIPLMDETSTIVLEHRFTHSEQTRIADVAWLRNTKTDDAENTKEEGEQSIFCIFEICNTHRTKEEDRPEPWYELNAETLIQKANERETTDEIDVPIVIPCIRETCCPDCLKQAMIQTIQKSKYAFVTQSISVMQEMFPVTTHMTVLETSGEDVSRCSDVLVNCTDNFTSDEKRVIGQFNINTVQELAKHKRISARDKQRCAQCFDYVCEKMELQGFEPINGHNIIQLGPYAINVRILSDGRIKYCKSWGKMQTTEFTTIGF